MMRSSSALVMSLGLSLCACPSDPNQDEGNDEVETSESSSSDTESSGTESGDSESSDTDSGDTDSGDTESGDTDSTDEGTTTGESLLGPTCSPALDDCEGGAPCCSTDPAAIDLDALDQLVLPAYSGKSITGGIPLFADGNNALSQRGICIDEDVPPQAGLELAPGCPIPCDPRWDNNDVEEVCGGSAICCQIEELTLDDCVFDPTRGDAGCWRPVTGFDIVGLGGMDLSEWGASEHATHQDPGLAADGACETWVAGLPPEVDPDEFRAACQRRLGVASSRGLCLGGQAMVCPYAQPSYRDACEQHSDELGLTSCDSNWP